MPTQFSPRLRHSLFTHPRFRGGWLLIVLAVINALGWTGLRWHYDQQLNTVQLVVDYSEVSTLADAYGVPRRELLRRLKRQGVTSVALYEQTLGTLRDAGRLAILPRGVAERLYPQARLQRYAQDYGYIVRAADKPLLWQVLRYLQPQCAPELPPLRVNFDAPATPQSPGNSRFMIAMPQSRLLLTETFVGYDPAQLSEVAQAGLGVVARPTNPLSFNYARLCAHLDAARSTGAHVVLFAGDDVLGYSTALPEVAQAMRQRKLVLCDMEFSPQRGLNELAERTEGLLLRGHTVPGEEAHGSKPPVVIDRYVRACRERDIRLLYVHLLTQYKSEVETPRSTLALPGRSGQSALERV